MAAFFNVHDADQLTLDARRRTRRRIDIIAISAIVLVSVVIAAVAGTAANKRNQEQSTACPLPSRLSVTSHCILAYATKDSVPKPETKLALRISSTVPPLYSNRVDRVEPRRGEIQN
ncbi:unnamed protein product [Rhodiola kirilowii]